MDSSPIWTTEAGAPSPHIAAAAVRVGRMLDRSGSEVADLRRSYHQHASGAYFAEPDMIKGEVLLVHSGLARRIGTRLVPTPELLTLDLSDEHDAASEIVGHTLAQHLPDTSSDELEAVIRRAIPSAERREELLLALGARFDDAHSRLIGEIGEELVVEAARHQLLAVGHPELAAQVRRVSLGSDALGYDVSAPRTTGSRRMFEVKASSTHDGPAFFLSRNEWRTGIRNADDWFLVYCRIEEVEKRTGEIVGWCPASSLTDHVPDDRGSGEWRSVHRRRASGGTSDGSSLLVSQWADPRAKSPSQLPLLRRMSGRLSVRRSS